MSITQAQLNRWAGRTLSNEEIDRLTNRIPNSSIPEAINAIVAGWSS